MFCMNMNNHKSVLKITLTCLALLMLSGCNALQPKPAEEDTALVDLLETRKQANEAYLNDDLATAEKHYTTLIKEMPQEAEFWFRLGNIYVATDRPYASMNLYREAVIRDPKFAKAWYNLGVVQLKQTAFSLNEMLIYTDKQDPLYSKATEMLDDIKAIIRE